MFAPWKKSCDKPRQHIKKQRLYFAKKVRLVGAIVFPVVLFGCESWTVKKAECQKIDALDCGESWVPKNWCFWTVVMEKTLESPRVRRSKQSILKEISPEYSLEGLMLKLKLQYFGHLMQRTDSFEKTLRPWCWERLRAGEGNDRGWDGWMTSLTQWTWVWVSFGSWWWIGRPGVLQSMRSQRVGHNWATELNWAEPTSN